jgi:hypothetical protein
MARQLPAPAEEEMPASRPGGVVLDIGGEVGAAVVLASEDRAWTEIEISRMGRAWDGTHTMVRPRHVGSAVVHAGVFPALRAGRYRVRPRGSWSAPATTIEVRGGRVTYAELESRGSLPV